MSHAGLSAALQAAAALIFVSMSASRAVADPGHAPERPPIPEPILIETATDIDAFEACEYEIEANAISMRPLRGGGFHLVGSVEAEWLITRRFGVRIEPSVSRDLDRAGADGETTFAGSLAASWKLFHDFRHDFHGQIEMAGRLPWTRSPFTEPGESALPFVFDLPVAYRPGPITLRSFVGAGAGRVGAHVPARGGLALLAPLGPSDRFGFFGVEVEADGARRAPFVVALDVTSSLMPVGVPVRLGFALPWVIGARADEPALGLMFRLIVEPGREFHLSQGSP